MSNTRLPHAIASCRESGETPGVLRTGVELAAMIARQLAGHRL